ncbi:MAG: ADP-ribosylglycohydrolase family protein [Bacteroidota bacterium]
MNDGKQRALNSMIGLAVGDAVSWTAMFHRSVLLPEWTRRIRREIDASSEATNVIVTPMPFSLNQPAYHFDISPTDETEWAAFSAGSLLQNGLHGYDRSILNEWLSLVKSTAPIRGGVSTQAALANLKKGIRPPQSGKENPHYFDDGAMSRAVPIGLLCAGQPDAAARVAEIDASVTNSEDGIWAAQSMAVVLSLICSGKTISEAIDTALQYLPTSSWIHRTVTEAMNITAKTNSIFSVMPQLQTAIVNREYSYGNAAPETLALALSIAKVHGNHFETAVMTSSMFAKSGETLPAMVGALSGAMDTSMTVSEQWMNAIRTMKGICIPSLAGKDYTTLAMQISNMAGQKISS